MRAYLNAMEILNREIIFDNFGTLILMKDKEGEEIIHGIASLHNEYYQHIISFQNGIPFEKLIGRCYAPWYDKEGNNRENFAFELTLDEFLELSNKDLNSIKSKIKQEDKVGAVYASRHHYLQGVMDFLKEHYRTKIHPSDIKPKLPGTGVYVISENFFNHPTQNHFEPENVPLEAFKIISENQVHPVQAALLLTHIYGHKFGDIKPNTPNLFDSRTGGIMNLGYFAHEVPDYAVPWIKNPITITLQ
jgi:hypothetical protein